MTLSSHHLQFYHIRTQNKINLGILPGVSLEKNRPEDLSMKAIKIILKTVLLISLTGAITRQPDTGVQHLKYRE